MPKVDLTITISVVIAICAIISPVITTILNNHHAYKMKKLDMEKEAEKASRFYKRGVYENYLKYTGRCVLYASGDALNQYGEAYALALAYFPPEFERDLIAINNYLQNHSYKEATNLFNVLAPELRKTLQKL